MSFQYNILQHMNAFWKKKLLHTEYENVFYNDPQLHKILEKPCVALNWTDFINRYFMSLLRTLSNNFAHLT
jgi:hypothetical protein